MMLGGRVMRWRRRGRGWGSTASRAHQGGGASVVARKSMATGSLVGAGTEVSWGGGIDDLDGDKSEEKKRVS